MKHGWKVTLLVFGIMGGLIGISYYLSSVGWCTPDNNRIGQSKVCFYDWNATQQQGNRIWITANITLVNENNETVGVVQTNETITLFEPLDFYLMPIAGYEFGYGDSYTHFALRGNKFCGKTPREIHYPFYRR